MQYNITTGKKPVDTKLIINIDQIPAFAVPAVVMIGVGNKSISYRKYLEKNLFNMPMLVNTFVKIHDMAISNGGMHLECKCKNKFHAQVLKEIFEEQNETLTSLISYFIPNSNNKANLDKEKESEEVAEPVPMMTMGTQTTLDQLNVPGADQLRAIIAADMEKERLDAEKNNQ